MEKFQDTQKVLSTFRSRKFSNKSLHSKGIYIQFIQPLTLAHSVVLSTIKNQVFTSVIELVFPPFTNTFSAYLTSKVFFCISYSNL